MYLRHLTDDQCTTLERALRAPWRPTLTSRQHRKRMSVVDGTETRASERWAPTPAPLRVLHDGTPVRLPARRIIVSPALLASVGSVAAARATVLLGGRWQPMRKTSTTSSDAAVRETIKVESHAALYAARLARFGAVGAGE